MHVDNATLVKYCFFMLSSTYLRTLPYRRFLETRSHFPLKKLRKSHKKRVRMRSPVRHHFGEHLGSILAPFWYPFGSQNRSQSGFEGVKNLVEKVKRTKTRKKWPTGPMTTNDRSLSGGPGPPGRGRGGRYNASKQHGRSCLRSNTPLASGQAN